MLNIIITQANLPSQSNPTVPNEGLPGLGELISNIFNYSLWILGIAVFLMIFAAGFKWLTAAGSAGKIQEAKSMIYNAIIGAIMLLSSVIILQTINPDLVKSNFTLPGIESTGTGGSSPPGPGPPPPTNTSCGGSDPICSGDCSSENHTSEINSANAAVLDNNPRFQTDFNTLPNRLGFINAVVAELNSRPGINSVIPLNGNGNPTTGVLVAVWKDGDTTMERYDVLAGGVPNDVINGLEQALFEGDIPFSCI